MCGGRSFVAIATLLFVLRDDPAAGAGWRQILDGGWGTSALVDAGGDVFVGGRTDLPGFEKALIVLRLDGASGAELWRREIDGTDSTDCCTDGTEDTVLALAQVPGGDVVAAGLLDNAGTQDDFTVMRLDAATGTEVWRQELDGGGNEAALALVADPMGDVYAAGTMVVKFDGATGGELWSYDIGGRANAVATAIGSASTARAATSS